MVVENAILISHQSRWYRVILNIWFQEVFLLLKLPHLKRGRRENAFMEGEVVCEK